MKITKPYLKDLLTKRNPYKNRYTNEIRYLDIQEWMVAESVGKQKLHEDLAKEVIEKAINMTALEFKTLLDKQSSYLTKIVVWEILEDKPSLQVLFGKKD